MRGPARQADDLEGGGNAPFGIGKALLIQGRRLQKDLPLRRAAQAAMQRVAFAHSAQVMHQMQRIPVAHGLGKAVGDGQRKSGPLQQTAQITDFAHRHHAGRQAAGHGSLRLGQTSAQFVQGLPTEHEAQKQPVGHQRVPALHQLAHRIIRPVQAQRMNHQILLAWLKTQHVIIYDKGAEIGPKIGKRRDNGRARKRPVNLVQSFLGFVGHFLMQEKSRGTGTVARQGGVVGQKGWRLHGAEHEGDMPGLQAALHMIYPPQCIACDAMVTSDFGLCGVCWRETPFITGLVCDLCGTPLPGTDPDHAVHCDDCLRVARPWSRGRAAMLYKDRARDMVLALKHADRLDLARPAAGWLLRAVQPILQPKMLVAPVPLHWRRLFKRRYNQSALLSAQLARLAGLDHCPDLLQRHRSTGSQEGRNRDERFRNMSDSMRLHRKHAPLAEGRHILLVDDVMTSGATFAAAAEACLAGGAGQISILALTRVAKDA